MTYDSSIRDAVEYYDALSSVLRERNRQDEKWGEQNHNLPMWLVILMEEVGELSKEVFDQYWDFNIGKPSASNLRTEAVQVAAVALAIIECIDRNS